jgi:hypothetical protein
MKCLWQFCPDTASSRLMSKNMKIFPLVLYECETLSRTSREEHTVGVFENRARKKKYFGVEMRWRKVRKEEFLDCYSSPVFLGCLHHKDGRCKWQVWGETRCWWGNMKERNLMVDLGVKCEVCYLTTSFANLIWRWGRRMNEWLWGIGGMILTWDNRWTHEKNVSVLTSRPHIPHRRTWDLTPPQWKVGNLTAWAMARSA